MADAITRAQLAEEASKLGFTATGWIHEVLGCRDEWNETAPAETVAAFLASFRERLNSIEARAQAATGSNSQT